MYMIVNIISTSEMQAPAPQLNNAPGCKQVHHLQCSGGKIRMRENLAYINARDSISLSKRDPRLHTCKW